MSTSSTSIMRPVHSNGDSGGVDISPFMVLEVGKDLVHSPQPSLDKCHDNTTAMSMSSTPAFSRDNSKGDCDEAATDSLIPPFGTDRGSKGQHHADANDYFTARGCCCLHLTNVERRLRRLHAAEERLAERERQSVAGSQETEEVFVYEGVNPQDLWLVRLEDRHGRPQWQLQGTSHSNTDEAGRFVDSATLSEILGKEESQWTTKEEEEVIQWLGRREDELNVVIKIIQAEKRNSRCCTRFSHKFFRDKFTARFCCCMPWGGREDNTESGCCCLKQRLLTDVEIRLLRLQAAETKLREEKEQSVAVSLEVINEELCLQQRYNPLDFHLLRLEDRKWKVEGVSGSYQHTDGSLVTINSAVLSAILNKTESLWTIKERSDVLKWLEKREKDITDTTRDQNLKIKKRTSPCSARLSHTIFQNEFTAPCCCCLGWGIFYKDSSGYADNTSAFHWWQFVFGIICIGLYVLDVATDLWLASTLLLNGDVGYFGFIFTFVFLAYAVNVCITLVNHVDNKDFEGKQWIPISVGVLFAMGPCISTAVYLYYGCKSRQTGLTHQERKDYAKKTKDHRIYSYHQRLAEGFIEAAPQLIFQLFLLVQMPEIHGTEGVMRVLSIMSSWFSVSLTVAIVHNFYRGHQAYPNIRYLVFDCLQKMAETASRVLSISLFTSVFRYWVLAFLASHFVLMALWYCRKDSGSLVCVNVTRCFLMAFSSHFSFEMFPECNITYSRIQRVVFYILFHSENVALLLLWYLYTEGPVDWVRPWGLVVGLVFLPLHVGLLLLYYGLCHPSSEVIRGRSLAQLCNKDNWRRALWEKMTGQKVIKK